MTLGWEREVISEGDLFQRILTQRWASTLTSRHQSNTRPSIERSERSYILFRKPKAKVVPFTVIVVNHEPETPH
jgi:hypothetical protein